MIKRVLIACYLVLCAYFSFAQGGEVVLEIPMDLKGSFTGASGYYGYIIENQEKNKYALLARDGSKVYFSLLLLSVSSPLLSGRILLFAITVKCNDLFDLFLDNHFNDKFL
jgi:hypothetical protein